MNLNNLFSRPLYIRYYGRLCSEATIFYIIITLIRYILPFVIVWRSDSFWIKESSFREMPDVDFKKDFILLLDVKEIDQNQLHKTYGFSTFPLINKAFRGGNQWIPVNVAQYEIDYDHDGKYDELNIKIEIPLDWQKEQVFGIRMLPLFWYRLDEKITFQMESLAEISFISFQPIQTIHVEGDLELVQKNPFPNRGYEFRYNRSLFNTIINYNSSTIDKNPIYLQNILKQYFNQKYYTRLIKIYEYWHPHIPMVNNGNEPFKLELTIHYRDILFRYQTGFWFLIKWALIQYLAIFMVIDYFISLIKSYVFEKYLVATMAQLSDQELICSLLAKKHF